jgi:E3 ubiquitin-protein ligase RNF13/E3 ubiquitin-protein ligase RNF167
MSRYHISHIFILALALQARANPLSFLWSRKATATLQGFQDQSWLWGWAWGPDSTVSIVDRSPPVTFPSRPAGFGAELSDPLLGYVIPLNSFTAPCSNKTATSDLDSPNLGCPSLCSEDPDIPERLEPWIALVQRGHCQFVSKAREAQRLGARAIVVGGENPDISGRPDTLVNMFSPGSSCGSYIRPSYLTCSAKRTPRT